MKTHWKKAFDSPYLGSWDLEDYKDITLTIKVVKSEMTKELKENSTMNVAYFKEPNYKPMLLNATNSKTLKMLAGSPYIEDWAGIEVTIGVETVKAFGEMHDALRIRKVTKKKSKPILNEQSDKWQTAKERVQGGMTFEELSKHYQISKEDFTKLQTK